VSMPGKGIVHERDVFPCHSDVVIADSRGMVSYCGEGDLSTIEVEAELSRIQTAPVDSPFQVCHQNPKHTRTDTDTFNVRSKSAKTQLAVQVYLQHTFHFCLCPGTATLLRRSDGSS